MKKRKKIIVSIVGLPGAGKTTTAEHFARRLKVPVIIFGDVVNKYIDSHNLLHTKDVHVRTWKELRKKYSMGAFAILNEKNIRESLNKSRLVVIDGMRSWEEYVYLKKQFLDVDFCIVAIFTDKIKRYKRSAKRTYRAKLYGQERDLDELFGTNMGPTIALADYIIENNSSKEEFLKKIDKVFNKINIDQ